VPGVSGGGETLPALIRRSVWGDGGETLGEALAVARCWRRRCTKSSGIVDLVNNPSPAGRSCISASQQHGFPIISGDEAQLLRALLLQIYAVF
jgi:hypothetical protein